MRCCDTCPSTFHLTCMTNRPKKLGDAAFKASLQEGAARFRVAAAAEEPWSCPNCFGYAEVEEQRAALQAQVEKGLEGDQLILEAFIKSTAATVCEDLDLEASRQAQVEETLAGLLEEGTLANLRDSYHETLHAETKERRPSPGLGGCPDALLCVYGGAARGAAHVPG